MDLLCNIISIWFVLRYTVAISRELVKMISKNLQIEKFMSWYDILWLSIVLSPLVVYYSILLFTNVLVPHFKKKSLLEAMRIRANWSDIESTVNGLEQLFKRNHAKMTSAGFRMVHRIQNQEFVYGEIDFFSFYCLLEKTKPQAHEVFYDLGSGAGKAVFAAAFFFDFTKSCGIELLEPLYNKATKTLNKAKGELEDHRLSEAYLKHLSSIEFIQGSFLESDFYEADVLYVAATCLNDDTWENLINKMAQLKSGTRIIVATKDILHVRFVQIHQGIELMSWGLCPVHVYQLK